MLGFVNVFKPAGPTSAHVVARLRRIYGLCARDRQIAAGHLGTLDPQAAGVLPIAIGKATRLIPLLTDQRKAYACTLVLGRSTTTQDAFGETVEARPRAGRLAAADRRGASGVRRQNRSNPADVFGRASRRQTTLRTRTPRSRRSSASARPVTVYALTLLGFEALRRRALRIACSEGTYVRTLCHDIGAAIGSPGAHGRARA